MAYPYFDQSRSILAGIPRPTLLQWQAQLQQALFNWVVGGNPLELTYMQGDGRKHVTFNPTDRMQLQGLLELVNACLGNPPVRRPMRVFFH